MDKSELLSALKNIATLLEVKGENQFRIRAYSSALRAIEVFEGSYEDLLIELDEGAFKGIGKTVAAQIIEAEISQSFSLLDELIAEFPDTLLDLLEVSGLGAKKLSVLYHEKGISSLVQLEEACKEDSLSDLKGFGKKTIDKFLAEIEKLKNYDGFVRLSDAWPLADQLAKKLGATVVGSVRRRKEIVRNINLMHENLITASEALARFSEIESIDTSSEKLVTATSKNGIPILLHSSEAGIFNLTGNSEHLEFFSSVDPQKQEPEIYSALSLNFIEPELRDIQDIKLAADLSSKTLIGDTDIRGILHAHSTYSDGKNTLREMAKAIKELGYEYLGITDHSQTAAYAGGLSVDEIKKQHEEIDRLNEELTPFVIFKGIESDILKGGELDYSDLVLDSFDFIIASVHSRFTLSREEQTARIVNAVKNPHTTILGHMTGRLLLKREPYDVDIEAVISAAGESGTCIEINANPRRLDLDWRFHQLAVKNGISLPICPDAHSIAGVDDVRYGIAVARKGGLQSSDVLNCKSLSEISNYFRTS